MTTLTDLNTMEERLELMKETVKPFKQRGEIHDKEGTFPFDNFNDLKDIGYPALTIPKKFGGMGISLCEMLKHQEIIAQADGATALSIGWHMGITKHTGENESWDHTKFQAFADDVKKTGALMNNAATEPATGSPTRGGKPETTAAKSGDGWIINGRKTFTTMAPILSYAVVSATIEDSDEVGNFLIRRELDGVHVDETWDSVAMKASGSHDLVLENVRVAADDLIGYLTPGKKAPAGWLLHIPACYLGIAKAAQEYATKFAAEYSPNSIKGTIAELPNVKEKLGEMELRIMQSSGFLYSVAAKWDASSDKVRASMKAELGAVKVSVVNQAVEVVDLAMRVTGARSLSAKNPLQRYYRDVRAGIHNPPMDDMVIMQLGDHALNRME
ncbi:acyl-CoA dehydrogenase family protein [Virgibacillus siamensis]|uniref:acyl-CoA dehydrogenase family protein n=1 Tax=Virgibacillus siamensis TaxID=480071 RepID=UPI000987CF02|nr:acyl-CoA dehydrogenase family protein [Virgibacillus siamensis]